MMTDERYNADGIYDLRPPVPTFTGRDEVCQRLVQHLRGAAPHGAVALITGDDGLGKTELAFAVAHQLEQDFPDALLFLNLRVAGDKPLSPERALQQIIHAFNPQAQVLDDLALLRERCTAALNTRRVLIVADDAHSTEQVAALLPPPPGCVLLITCRHALDISLPAQHLHTEQLPPLPTDAAANLLHTLRPRLALSESDTTRLAEACGGVPLALRLCAGLFASSEGDEQGEDDEDDENDENGNSGTIPDSDVDVDIDHLLEQLAAHATHVSEQETPATDDTDNDNDNANATDTGIVGGAPGPGDILPPVAAALHVSYHALNAATRATLRQLAVFQASFDMDAAKAVVQVQHIKPEPAKPTTSSSETSQPRQKGRAVAPGVEQLIAHLCRALLVEYDSETDSYLLHRSIRVATAALIDETDRKAYLRYARHYATIAGDIEALYVQGSDRVLDALAQFDQERLHIEAGWRLAHNLNDHHLLLTYTCVIGYTGQQRYHMQHEYIPQAEEALAAARRLRRRGDECHVLNVLGSAYRSLGRLSQALDTYRLALELVRSVKKLGNEGAILRNMGNAQLSQGDVPEAIKLYKRALKMAQKTRDMREQCDALGKLGLAYTECGDTQKALASYEQCLGMAREFFYRDYEGEALGGMGMVYVASGEPENALKVCQQAHAIACEMLNRRDEGYALFFLGRAHAAAGDTEQAQAHLQQAHALACDIGERRLEGRVLNELGTVSLAQGNPAQATAQFEQAMHIAQETADRPGEVISAWNLGLALRDHAPPSEHERATDLLHTRVAYEQAIGHPDAAYHADMVEQSGKQV